MNYHLAGRLRLALFLILSLLIAAFWMPNARADDAPAFAGSFANDTLTLELSQSDGGYVGTITLSGKSFPAKATASGATLTGTFTASNTEFPFTATLQNGQLLFSSGGTTHTLTRTPVNPLASGNTPATPLRHPPAPQGAPGPADQGAGVSPSSAATGENPPAADPSSLQKLDGFTVLGSSANGQALFIDLAGIQSLESAITQAADTLRKVLDSPPALAGAFANAHTHNTGGATFTGKLKGQDIRGLILCGPGVKGYTAAVLFAATKAPKDEYASLLAYLPVQMRMKTHAFPDNSGSIDLPDGWTTPNQSATYGILVKGPAGQTVLISRIINVWDPNCTIVRQSRQVYEMQMRNYQFQMNQYQQALQMRARYPNIPMPREPVKPTAPDPDPNVQFKPLIFCRYCDGVEDVLKYFYPVSEAKAKAAGGDYTSLDKVIGVQQVEGNPYITGSKGGVVYLAVTDHLDGKEMKVRLINRIMTAPTIQGENWQLAFTIVRAPDASFERDLPVMYAILNSVNPNMDVVNKQIADDGAKVRAIGAEQFRQLLQRGRDFQQAQDEHFRNFEAQMAAQQQARHDSASDFIEYIRGVRDIYDTQTGQMLQGDLFNIDGIVNGLNAATNNPGQFIQIPLRYER